MLEANCHEQSCFATFTYAKEPSDACVHKSHISSTLKRLRKYLGPAAENRIRFFAVGEYGETTQRPHYHAAIFGLGLNAQGDLQRAWDGLRDPQGSEPGFTHVGDLTPDSASYIASYCTKKLTKADDARLGGRRPEFALMSRRPGLGAGYLEPLIEALSTREGSMYLAAHKDVPTAFSIAGKLMPLGPYIRAQLRDFFLGDPKQPQAAKDQVNDKTTFFLSTALSSMQLNPEAFARIQIPDEKTADLVRRVQQVHIHHHESIRAQRNRQVNAKHRINQSRKRL